MGFLWEGPTQPPPPAFGAATVWLPACYRHPTYGNTDLLAVYVNPFPVNGHPSEGIFLRSLLFAN